MQIFNPFSRAIKHRLAPRRIRFRLFPPAFHRILMKVADRAGTALPLCAPAFHRILMMAAAAALPVFAPQEANAQAGGPGVMRNRAATGFVALASASTATNFTFGSPVVLSVTAGVTNAAIAGATNRPRNTPPDSSRPTAAAPAIVSNWWTASGPGNFAARGSGLRASFTPTNGGPGTVTFNVAYVIRSNSPPRGGGNVRADSLTLGFNVLQLTNQCFAATPANRARTTVGVGEEVKIGLAGPPSGIFAWSASAGGVSNAIGTSTVFTAPSNGMSATVTLTLPEGQSLGRTFTVVEPSGEDHADLISLYEYETNQSGAGMYCTVYVGPTNVSFYRVQMIEVATNAADITGYYADPDNTWDPPEDLKDTEANFWFEINADNSWQHNGQDDGNDYDRAWWSDDNPPWASGGSLTWNYSAQWKIGTGPTNTLPTGWSQHVTLGPDGTITVQKFGHTITRNTNNVYTTQH